MKKIKQPLVSIIMPVYNAGDFLVEAIESIVNQTYKAIEFIIVDDDSTDGSWKIIRRYKRRYPKIIQAIRLKNRLNRGGDACANIAYQEAKGKYIARMDADDIAVSNRIELQVKFLKRHPTTLMVGSQAYVIDKDGVVVGEKNVPTEHEAIYDTYCIFHPMIHPTILFRKSLLPKRKSLYKIKYNANNDLYTFLEFLQRGTFANLPQKLLYYRIHGGNDSLIHPKQRFFNTLAIRFAAVTQFGYKPTIKHVLLNLIELIAILFVPEKFILPLYLYIKGIYNPFGMEGQLSGSVNTSKTIGYA